MYTEEEGEVFLGRSATQHKQMSDETAHVIDEEIRRFIDRNYDRAAQILNDHMEKLHTMADALIRYETIDADRSRTSWKGAMFVRQRRIRTTTGTTRAMALRPWRMMMQTNRPAR